jgi:uncharacterized protein
MGLPKQLLPIRWRSLLQDVAEIGITVAQLEKSKMELTQIHDRNLQMAKIFMATLAEGAMDRLMIFWAEDGVLEFPFHPPNTPDRIVGKPALTEYFQGTTSTKKPSAFPITGSYPMLDPNFVFMEFDGQLQNLKTGEHYTNKYCVLLQFNEAGEVKLFREFFNSLKRQQFEVHN